MQHYLDEDGKPVDYRFENHDVRRLVEYLKDEWNKLLEMELEKEEHYARFNKIWKDYIWDCRGVMHQYRICKDMKGLGGCRKVDELYKDDPKNRKILLTLVRWVDEGFLEGEFPLYFHNIICDITFSFYFSEENL